MTGMSLDAAELLDRMVAWLPEHVRQEAKDRIMGPEMLQQMAAESTGTAAPIHLQGEPMATAPTPTFQAVPGHNWWVTTSGAHGRVDQWAECECGWRGTTHRVTVNGEVDRHPAHADGLAHAAQFKAPETLPLDAEPLAMVNTPAGAMRASLRYMATMASDADAEHLRAYAAKRAEWLQAKHDDDVADKATGAAYSALDQAQQLYAAARKHREGTSAAVENLQAELLALVKGEQA